MNRFSLKLGIAAAALALAAPAAATNGMRMIGFGPVQNSMGGASAAVPLDATTVVTNPAGLSALSPRVDLGATTFMPTVQYDAAWNMGPLGAGTPSQESDRPVDVIPTLAGVYRVQDKLTLGFAALGTAGMGVDYAGGADGLFGSRTYTNYMNMRVAPAASYKVTEALSVGGALNVNYAMMSFLAGPMVKRETAGALGLGATIGATFAVNPMLTFAAAYESKSSYQDFEFDVPAHTAFFGFDGTGAPIFQPVPGGKETLDFDQPAVATVGAAIRPIDGLLLAADVEWINWSDTNGENQPEFTSDQAATAWMPWNLDWSDQVVFKLGAQYAVQAVKGLAVRAGYNYGKSPLNEDRAFENVAFPAIAEHHFTVGAGYDAGPLTVNVAAQYSPEATLQGSDPMMGIGAYEARMSQLAFDLGVAYRF